MRIMFYWRRLQGGKKLWNIKIKVPTSLGQKKNQPFQRITEFSSEFGVPEFIKDLDNPDLVTLFQLFDEFLEFMASQTNQYAQQAGKPYKSTDKI